MDNVSVSCTTPSPASRKEAWAAWEAAHLSGLDRKFPVRKHLKIWERVFRGPSRWWLYAIDTRPNRMEVKVRLLSSGEEIWVKIGLAHSRTAAFEKYAVVNGTQEMLERQHLLHRIGAPIRLGWILESIPEVDIREEADPRGWYAHAVYKNGRCITRGSCGEKLLAIALKERHYTRAILEDD